MLFEALDNSTAKSSEKPLVLFVTLTFKRTHRVREDGQAKLDAFSHFYNLVCRSLVGRNFHRDAFKSDLPFAMAFLDCEGSKFSQHPLSFQGLHIHSLWIIPEAANEQFNGVLGSIVGKGREGEAAVDAVDVQKIDADDLVRLDRVCSYSSKMLGPNHLRMEAGEDFRILPWPIMSDGPSASA